MELLVNLYDRLGTRCSLFKGENRDGSRYVLERIVSKQERDCIELTRAEFILLIRAGLDELIADRKLVRSTLPTLTRDNVVR